MQKEKKTKILKDITVAFRFKYQKQIEKFHSELVLIIFVFQLNY